MQYTIEELDGMSGHDFEYAVADLLFHNGYRDVTVTQGSGDFGIDILARRKNVKYAIQCKRFSSKVSVSAVQQAGLGTDFYHCDAAAVITNSTFTNPAIKLAQTTGVRLWDRNFLEELIDNYDDEYDEIDPHFAQEYGSITNRIQNQLAVSEKAKKSDKGIELAKNIYAKTGYIYFGNTKFSYKRVAIFNHIIFWVAWIIIALSIIYVKDDMYASLGCVAYSGFWLIYHIKIKKVLSKYKELRERKQI